MNRGVNIMLIGLKKMDWVINGCVAALATASLLVIYSINYDNFTQQAIWFGLGLMVIIVFSQIDWRPLMARRGIIFSIYLAAVALLVATYFFAPVIRGTRSWLVFGSTQLQTSELAKLALIVLLSYYFAQRHVAIGHWQNLLVPFFYFLVPFLLILIQPDLGSALVLSSLFFGYLLVSGIHRRHLIIGILIITVILVGSWFVFLKDYQKERIIGLFNPDYDPLGVNYNTIQSKIAIGSGGWLGRGLGQGTQVQLGFLPEAATDFIFAALTEEWGLVGALLLIGVFTLLVWRIIKVGLLAESNFFRLICLGTAVVFLIHFLFNVGSNVGLLPVIGMPLPLFSYGGSSLLTNAMLIGIIQSIVVRFSF